MTKLVCPECRHENEAERVYCHNCGARLNRPAVVSGKSAEAQTAETRERLRRMMDNRGVKARQITFGIAKLFLASFAAAVLILMFSTPDLPTRSEKEMDLGPQIGLDLENALLQHRGEQLTYSEDQVNNYLANVLKRKKTSLLDKPLLEFRRGLAQFGEGTFRMTVERSFLGLSLYTSASYRANVQSGKIAATNESGAIGRLPIYPQLMSSAHFLLNDVWKALEQDRKQVEKMAAVEFHSQSVVLTPSAP
jgi:hypothetical protein